MCIMILVVRTTTLHIAGWSSLAARRAHNPKVVGSNPTPATIWRHSSAGQSIRFIPEVSCVRITLPLPKNPVKLIAWLDFFYSLFFRYACAIGACGEGMTEAMRRFAVDVDCCANTLPQATICLKGERLMRTLLFEWCVATFILPKFVNYVFFFLRNLLYLILCINVFPT